MRLSFSALAGFLLLTISNGEAQEQYRGLQLAPYEIFEAVLSYASEENFSALEKSIKHFDPLLDALGKHCHKDLRAALEDAIRARNKAAAQDALLEIIFEDFSMNLEEAIAATSVSVRRERIEMSYVDYTFLAPRAEARDATISAAVKVSLSRMARLEDPSGIEPAARAIYARLAQAVPHCRAPETLP